MAMRPRLEDSRGLEDPEFAKTVIIILVRNLGGEIDLTQRDFDKVRGDILSGSIEKGVYRLSWNPNPSWTAK